MTGHGARCGLIHAPRPVSPTGLGNTSTARGQALRSVENRSSAEILFRKGSDVAEDQEGEVLLDLMRAVVPTARSRRGGVQVFSRPQWHLTVDDQEQSGGDHRDTLVAIGQWAMRDDRPVQQGRSTFELWQLPSSVAPERVLEAERQLLAIFAREGQWITRTHASVDQFNHVVQVLDRQRPDHFDAPCSTWPYRIEIIAAAIRNSGFRSDDRIADCGADLCLCDGEELFIHIHNTIKMKGMQVSLRRSANNTSVSYPTPVSRSYPNISYEAGIWSAFGLAFTGPPSNHDRTAGTARPTNPTKSSATQQQGARA